MWGTIVVVVSALVAVLAVLREEGKGSFVQGLAQLSKSGRIMVALAVVGLIAGVVKNMSDSRNQDELLELVRGIHMSTTKGIQDTTDPDTAELLRGIKDDIETAGYSTGGGF